MFEGKVLLITGGTGTFGNAVMRRFLQTPIKEIRVFSRDEKKQEEVRMHYNSPKIKSYIGDVRAYDSIASAMYGVDYVFHAAALKQVPSCEFYPLEALRTNALGAENVMNAAIAGGVKRLIVLSTDKAVYPINAMGISKAMMEKLMVAKSRVSNGSGTVLCGTRYGNVMASRGSVIPLFIRQIREGKPLTVTDLHMTRFMMSIEDAVDLVLYAFEHGHQGDIFVQKAPSATIETLALAVKKVFGAANPIEVIGTRHGEKQYETLLTREERAKAEDEGSYFRVRADNRDLNYNAFFSEGQTEIAEMEDFNSNNARILNVDEMAELLLSLDYIRSELKAAGSIIGQEMSYEHRSLFSEWTERSVA
ncbi:MAG: polysaccharide biosynthesis protein [Acidobacteriota bacterium]